ncbi:glycosyltransferase [Candidatus Ruminimicrobium bovinum]|uniref:glycosyltransferase n=1 Tax=Candidatus Ruminimicrobium bovinum TaxID=3242779 RepID=UPI0039B9143C
MDKIKVLHVFSSDTIGGAEKQTVLTTVSLKQFNEKYEPILAAPKKSFLYEQAESNGVKVVDFKCRGSFTPTGVLRLFNIVRKENISIIHVHQGKLYWTALLMKLFFKNLKIVLHRRQDTRHKWYAKWHYKIADKTLTVSKAVRDNLIKYEKVSEDKVQVLYNAFDFEKWTKQTDTSDIIKKYNLENKFVIGTVGAIVSLEGKGQQYLLEAIAELKKDYPNIVALIVGDGAGMQLQQDYAKNLGVDDISIFTGYQSEIPKFLKVMNIFCLLSCDTEGFGNVNLEAQALKIPVITTTVGGNPETIIDGVTGFLIPPRNTDMLISSIKKLITDKLMSDKMAIAGEKFVKETFSKQKLSSSLTDIYDGVLK